MNEKEMKAKDVFAHALAYFKEEAEKALRLRSRRIKWVLTVPAIWTQRARQFMRDAAYQVKNLDIYLQSKIRMINIGWVSKR